MKIVKLRISPLLTSPLGEELDRGFKEFKGE